MKVLVIHPNDKTTNFLCPAYVRDFTTIRTNIGDALLKSLIRQHDIIIMMGHGDEKGLFGHGRYIVTSDFVYELRNKTCIYIWCHASDFVKKYSLKTPFATGMFISEVDEAYLEGVKFEGDDIYDSNYWFVEGLEVFFLNILDKTYKIEDLSDHYKIGLKEKENNIIQFNVEQFYSNL